MALAATGIAGMAAVAVPSPVAAADPCGGWSARLGTEWQVAYYKHCTSGTGSLRVRAIWDWWPDGDCETVPPNARTIIDWAPIINEIGPDPKFAGIQRC